VTSDVAASQLLREETGWEREGAFMEQGQSFGSSCGRSRRHFCLNRCAVLHVILFLAQSQQ